MTSASALHSNAPYGSQNDCININEESSLNYWLAALECDEFQLRVAVAEVGPGARDVGDALGRRVA